MTDPRAQAPGADSTPAVAPMPTTPTTRNERIGVIRGDRLCQRCAYNLTGQPIFREAHYGLMIARCPECGEVAALQHQPVLANWLGRLHGLLLAVWFTFIIALAAAGTIALEGLAIGATETSSSVFENFLRERFMADDPASSDTDRFMRFYGSEFNDWWQKQDAAALFREAGGMLGAIDWWFAMCFIGPSLLIILVMGMTFAAILNHWSRWKLLIWWGVLAGFLLLWNRLFSSAFEFRPYAIVSVWDAARSQVAPVVINMMFVMHLALLLLALLFGRPLMRLAARFLLAPRLQRSLATLWRADGLEPPESSKSPT